MKRAIILAAILLAGCTHTRYVTVPCLTPQQYEDLKKTEPLKVREHLTGKADEDIRIIGGSAVRLRSWGQGMLGVLGGCVG